MPLKIEACRAKFMKIEFKKPHNNVTHRDIVISILLYFGGWLYNTITISEFSKIDKDTLWLWKHCQQILSTKYKFKSWLKKKEPF